MITNFNFSRKQFCVQVGKRLFSFPESFSFIFTLFYHLFFVNLIVVFTGMLTTANGKEFTDTNSLCTMDASSVIDFNVLNNMIADPQCEIVQVINVPERTFFVSATTSVTAGESQHSALLHITREKALTVNFGGAIISASGNKGFRFLYASPSAEQLIIKNVTIQEFETSKSAMVGLEYVQGGAIYSGRPLYLDNVHISHNVTGSVRAIEPLFDPNTFRTNFMLSDNQGQGGGVYMKDAPLCIRGGSFTGNESSGGGSAIYLALKTHSEKPVLSISGTDFTGNRHHPSTVGEVINVQTADDVQANIVWEGVGMSQNRSEVDVRMESSANSSSDWQQYARPLSFKDSCPGFF